MKEVQAFPLKFCDDERICFARLIIDEAQNIRNTESALSRLVRLIPNQAIHMVSATPTLNRIDDIAAFAYQV